MSLVCINTYSLSEHIEELEYFLGKSKSGFAVGAISKSRTVKNNFLINSINLKDYSYQSCPTSFQQVTSFYTLKMIFPTNLEELYAFSNLENYSKHLLKFQIQRTQV